MLKCNPNGLSKHVLHFGLPSRYNANTTLNNLPRNLTFEVPAATTVDKLGNTALQCPLLSDGGIQYPTWISIFKDWEVFLAETSASPDVEEFLAYNTPSLKVMTSPSIYLI